MDIFSGTVEVDETYLSGQWRNKRKVIWDKGTKRGRGTKKQPVFGILCRDGPVWAEVVNDVEAAILNPRSARRSHQDLLSIPILGKPTPELPYEVMFTVR